MTPFLLAVLFVILLALLLTYYPLHVEGFAVTAVHPTRMPACVERSSAAQSLLQQISSFPETNEAAAELRLLISKLCCLEADIATPAVGSRTLPLQFRTSHDMEPASTFVGRCLRNAVRPRDIELVMEKYTTRATELLHTLLGPSCTSAMKELEEVAKRTETAMNTFCLVPQPSMDHPAGPRDVGFWEPEKVADLSQYQGISAVPK
jgi:hypothetical protein